MQYRKMGSLPWEVSALGFGAMRLPTTRGLKPMSPDTAESIRIVRRGIDLGINYVDTAWFYHLGESERVLGRALSDGYRERVKLVTKLPVPLTRKPEDFEKYLHAQLERLRTDHLDVYLLHALDRGGFEKVKRLGFIEKMERARDEGLIGHIGFSFHDTLPVFKEIVDHYPWEVVQVQYNYMDTAVQAGVEGLRYAAEKGMAVVVMEPLKGGRLANPPAEALDIMRASAARRTAVDWALQFLWNDPDVGVVLSGMGSERMVEENCASADRSGVGSLSADEVATIEQLAEVYRRRIVVHCTACQYCMPCPQGVNIPQNFAVLNARAMEDGAYRRFQVSRSYRKLVRRADRVDAERPNGAAVLCTECKRCVSKCPQHIDIPGELKRVDAAFRRGLR